MEHRSHEANIIIPNDGNAGGNQRTRESSANVALEKLREEEQMGGPVNCSDFELSTYLQALGEGYLPTYYSGTNPSVPSRSMSIASKSYVLGKKMVVFHGFQFLEMSQNSTDTHGADGLTLSAEDSPARISAQPEKEQASQAPAQGFGLTWPASSARYDRATASWKIHPCLFPEDSMSCSIALPRWGTMRGGELSERTMPERLTSGTGSGSGQSWPTPRRLDGEIRESLETWEKRQIRKKAEGINLHFPLTIAVQMWPTPTVACATGGQTSRSGDRKGHTITENHPKGFTQSLANDVKMWPTPQTSDNRDRGHIGMPAIQRRQEKGKQIGLGQSVSDTSGALNPPWVEWLMGWPLGWTDLKPLAMDKFQQWQHSHGDYSHD